MEISKTFIEKVKSLIQKYSNSSNLELEARYTEHVTREQFDRCNFYCQDTGEDGEEDGGENGGSGVGFEETLDIFAQDVRITLNDKEDITNYCKINTLPIEIDSMTIIKKTQEEKPIIFDDIDFRINLKAEVPQEDTAVIIDRLYLLDKSYRYKKRYTYINKNDGIRIDLTVVKSAMGNYKNFIESRIVSAKENYEIEIEVIDKKVTAETFLTHMLNLYGVINDEDHVCPKTEKQDVLKEYFKLCYKELPANYERSPRLFFAGPQPVTLEKKNIANETLGVVSIQKDYTVTDKADGERCLLYIATSGKCYFINNRMSVKYTGVKVNNLKNVLIDGEYVSQDLIGDPIKYYAVFDAYYINGEDIRHLPLIGGGAVGGAPKAVPSAAAPRKEPPSRLSFVDMVLKNLGNQKEIQFVKKKFYYSGNIFEHSKTILNSEKSYPYHIDGLIYTPMYLPVGGMTMDDTPEKPANTWKLAYKWKPPEENTIDFLVKIKKGTTNNPVLTFINSTAYRTLDLRIGYDPSSWDKITPRSYLEGSIIKKKSYIEKEFHPADIIHDDISTCVIPYNSLCENGDIIEDDSIIEFKYDNTDDSPPFSTKWIPIRTRKDKTELYRKSKSIAGAANDISTAMNIWRTIRVPITKDMICGKVTVDKIPEDNDVYYDRKVKRDKFASNAMMRYHNDIKRQLISKYKGESVIDLACGKGGDIQKYIDQGFRRIYGLDSNRDNIENPVDGIYARLMDRRMKNGRYVFLTYDLSNEFDIEKIENADDKYVANVIYGHKKDALLGKYVNFAVDKFDLVSCQFAIHYFFESEKILDNFLNTVNLNIKDDGYFIGTCLNGELVKRALLNKTEIRGISDTNQVLWNIKKLYTKNTGVVYGEEIEVFMESIGRVFKEYLVNIDLLVKKLKPLGFELIENISFKDFADKVDNLQLDTIQKEYSFLNMAFVFKKTGVTKRIIKKKVPAS